MTLCRTVQEPERDANLVTNKLSLAQLANKERDKIH